MSQQSEVSVVTELAKNIQVTRLMSISGYAILLYDWLLTFPQEKANVWSARRSVPKWLFLVDRYSAIVILTLINLEIIDFFHLTFSNRFCSIWLTFHILWGTVSMHIGNGLVLLHLVRLWGGKRSVRLLLGALFTSVVVGSMGTLLTGSVTLLPHILYIEQFGFCGFDLASSLHIYALVWAIPLALNCIVIVMTAFNALARPRQVETKMHLVLAQDGMFYFLALFVIGLFNVLVIAIAPPSLVFCGGYFSWAMEVVLMNRFIVNVHQNETWESTAPSKTRQPPEVQLTVIRESLGGPSECDGTSIASELSIRRHNNRLSLYPPSFFDL